jgi:hypothetical protein
LPDAWPSRSSDCPTESKRLRELGDDGGIDQWLLSRRRRAARFSTRIRPQNQCAVYGPYETWLGNGIVGGYMTDIAAVTGTAGKAISQLRPVPRRPRSASPPSPPPG